VSPGVRRLVPPLTGAAVLVVVLWRTGTGPVVAGIRALDGQTLLLGALLGVLTTVASAWRWQLVARGLGVGVDLGPAVASYYRSQFLNSTLPGGVVGDVHRGVRHGRSVGATGLGVRAVVWERFAGQLVQAVLVLLGLVLLPSPVRGYLPEVSLGLVACTLAAWVLWRTTRVHVPKAPRLLRAVATDVRRGLLPRTTWPGIVLASAVAVTGYVATYLVAARAVGVTAAPERLVPLVLLVLLAAGLPFNLAGWGPREGMAAWSFGAAGLGAAHGMATAVAFGALVLVGTLPGAVVLALGMRRPARLGEPPASAPPRPVGTGGVRG
jgi:glycosyltransferase 2 family protein